MSVPYADNIVFNLTLYNKENVTIPAELYISRDQAFVNNLENYYVRLIGANVATDEIPLFIYKNDMFVEIVNDGVASRSLVNFEIPFSTQPNYIIFLQQFLNGVNNALKSSHINSGSPGNAPFFIYENEEMKLVVDQQYDINIQSIGLGEKLISKFPSFMLNHDKNSDMYYLQYGQLGNNSYATYPGGINYPVYVMRANVLGYSSVQEFTNIIVSCNSIPINKQQLNNLTISTLTLGILDVIPITLENITASTVISYTQGYPNYIDILSKGRLSEIDFKFYIVDLNYNLIPLTIIPKASATCRIEFVNKEIVKNYYPKDVISNHNIRY